MENYYLVILLKNLRPILHWQEVLEPEVVMI